MARTTDIRCTDLKRKAQSLSKGSGSCSGFFSAGMMKGPESQSDSRPFVISFLNGLYARARNHLSAMSEDVAAAALTKVM